MLLTLTLTALLSQDAAAAATTESTAEKAANAAVKAAEAAQKAAEAVQRIADAIAPQPAPAAPGAPADDAKKEKWKGNVGLGLTFITGNTQTLTMTGNVAADRSWGAWSLGIRASGAYGLANPSANVKDSTSAVTAERGNGTIRGDRTFGSGFAGLFVLVGSEFDHVKNIESRSIGEVGTGLTFFNKKDGDLEKLFLRLDLALRGGYESRYQYFPVASVDPYMIAILAPRVAMQFRWGFSKDVRFSEEIEFIPFVLAPNAGRLLINNTTKLNARLTETLSLATSLLINYDSSPPQATGATPRLPTDIALTVGVEAAF
jgi:putative salt-induced outer membrane protein YdiY